jgi:hypothetical protein
MMRILCGNVARTESVNVKDLCSEGSSTPPGCDPINIAFPWSPRTLTTGYFLCNPSGC